MYAQLKYRAETHLLYERFILIFGHAPRFHGKAEPKIQRPADPLVVWEGGIISYRYVVPAPAYGACHHSKKILGHVGVEENSEKLAECPRDVGNKLGLLVD